MTLLDTINAMETTFTLKDVIYLCGILIAVVAGWFKMQNDKEKLQTRATAIESRQDKQEEYTKESFMTAKNGRYAIRKELKDDLDKQTQVTHQRIDRVRDDNIKSYEKLEKRIQELDAKGDSHTREILEAIRNKK